MTLVQDKLAGFFFFFESERKHTPVDGALLTLEFLSCIHYNLHGLFKKIATI